MSTSSFTPYGTPDSRGRMLSITFSYDSEALTMTKSVRRAGRLIEAKTVDIDQDAADALDRRPANAWMDAASIFSQFE